MSIPWQKNEFHREPMAEGWYPAILRQVIYIGRQRFEKEKTVNGQVKREEWYSPQIVVGFELPTVTFESRTGEQYTKMMSMTLFASLSPSRSGLGFYEIATSLGALNIDDPDAFDESKLLGKSCEVRIASVMSKGKPYDNIVEVKLSEKEVEGGMKQNIHLEAEDFGNDLLIAQLPDWIQNKIFASEEILLAKSKKDGLIDPINGMPLAEEKEEEIRIEDVPF